MLAGRAGMVCGVSVMTEIIPLIETVSMVETQIDVRDQKIEELQSRLEIAQRNTEKAHMAHAKTGSELSAYKGECERLLRRLDRCRGALADIALSEDMTLELAQKKANRIYGETDVESQKREGQCTHGIPWDEPTGCPDCVTLCK